MTLGDIIKDFRVANDLSMDAFAERSGISKAYISLLEKNKHPKTGKPITPSITLIKSVAEAMKIDFNVLFSMIDGDVSLDTLDTDYTKITCLYSKLNTLRQEKVVTYAEQQLKEQEAELYIKEDDELYIVEVTEKLAAGNGYSYSEYNEKFEVCTDRDDLPRYDIASLISGDSMTPKYNDGEVALIQLGYDNVQGAVYAVDYDGKSYLKKVFFEGDRIRLVSINKKYEDIYIDLPVDNSTYLNIIGRVVDSFEPIRK